MRTPHGPNSKFNSACVITLPLSLPSFLPSCRPGDEGQMGQMSDDSIRGEKVKASTLFRLTVFACAESIYCFFFKLRNSTRVQHLGDVVVMTFAGTPVFWKKKKYLKADASVNTAKLYCTAFAMSLFKAKKKKLFLFSSTRLSVGWVSFFFLPWDDFAACTSDMWKCWQGGRSACQLK